MWFQRDYVKPSGCCVRLPGIADPLSADKISERIDTIRFFLKIVLESGVLWYHTLREELPDMVCTGGNT